MSSSYALPGVIQTVPLSIQFVAIGIVLAIAKWFYDTIDKNKPLSGFTLISLSEKGVSPKESWRKHASETLMKGLSTCSGPFQIMTGTGPKIVLPLRFADEIKSDDRFDFNKAKGVDLFIKYPGFEPLKDERVGNKVLSDILKVKLPQGLGAIIARLVDEATTAIHETYGEETEWHRVPLKRSNLEFISRTSSRIFVGAPLCRNKRWLEIVREYTVDLFAATREMSRLNPLLRPIIYRFLKCNRIIMKELKDANQLLMDNIAQRAVKEAEAKAAGQPPPEIADVLGWMVQLAGGTEMDYTIPQLGLTMAAIHTTNEALTACIFHICEHPEIVQPLREEIIEVLGQDHWSKASLYKLKLMDSFLKESQRMIPPNIWSMNRHIMSPVQLSDGTILPKDSRCIVAANYLDPAVFPDPGKFDVYRFLKIRQANEKKANAFQHATTSSDFIAFGYGDHACPGRFFASNVLKVILSHLLLKYDIAMDKNSPPAVTSIAGANITDPTATVMIRRRKEEIKLDLD